MGESFSTMAQTYSTSELMGKFIPAEHTGFTKIPQGYATRSNAYLRSEVLEAFLTMAADAREDGIDLLIVSSTRNFDRQVAIWERKWDTFGGRKIRRVQKILNYSSMPGTSRHHWGTDFDLNSVSPSFFNTQKGAQIYEWLRLNAYKYGFFQPYQTYPGIERTGYKEEKWHWSYYPTAKVMLEEYNQTIDADDIEDFDGSRYAERSQVIPLYVNGIVTAPFPLGQFPIPGSLNNPLLATESQVAKAEPKKKVLKKDTGKPQHISVYHREGPTFSSGPQLTFSQWIGK